MPAIWSSSERPISVRTVWVDGIRHAILSPDDPLINSKSRCSRVSRNKNFSTEYQQLESRLDRLNGCFTNLQVVVNNNLSDVKDPPQMYRKFSAPPCSRISSSTCETNTLESLSKDDKRMKKKHQHCHKAVKEDSDFFIDKRVVKNDNCDTRRPKSEPNFKSNATESRQIEGASDTFWNPLFERVLQWLDLSGRARSYDFEEDSVRRSPCEMEQKWSATKRRLPRLKRDSFEEKERIIVKNSKLHKECDCEYFKREENQRFQRRLPKIKNTKERFQEGDEMSVDPLPRVLNTGDVSSKSDEEESRNEIKGKASATTMWCPPGRLKLHVVIPNLVCKENYTSSQESLIND
ncbi:unnamed protein product [Xylocopa violacea]|uniref:Uncharacterized protein n=1 Tax=Xylocopa violacea TaxID=135666 RepID=A0ABP1NXW4_XYLVO